MATSPKRGEVWLVSLDPTVGSEIRKTRPTVVVSSDSVGALSVKIVAPITDWKEWYGRDVWHVQVEPDSHNGLVKKSAVDVMQLRSVDYQRFVRQIGSVSLEVMRDITDAIAIVIEIT